MENKIRERWIHVDCKYMPPSADALVLALGAWAAEGATGVLLEWENMFPFPGMEGTVRHDAYRKEEVARILARCRELGLKAVPLVQTLGHLEWLLSGPAFQHLREFPEDPRLIRACDPASLELLESHVDALIAAHADSPYIHLGGDEARGLQDIDRPECSSVRDGSASVYLRHMQPLLDRVIRAGKRPILWADMALCYPDRLTDFPRETVFCDWLYASRSDHAPAVRDWGQGLVDGARLREMDAARRALFEPYWSIDAPDFPDRFYQHPYLPFLRDRGFDVIGAPATLYAEIPLTVPPLPSVRANARQWLRALQRFDGLGAANTCWAIRGMLREVTMTGHRAFLHMACHPGAADDDPAVSAAAWAPIAGAGAGELAAALDAIAPPLDPLSRTVPLRYDPLTGMNRAIPFDERWSELAPELAAMDDGHAAVSEHRSACDAADRARPLFERYRETSSEAEAWSLSLAELALRAKTWLAARDAARGGRLTANGAESLRKDTEAQAEAMRAFMSGRYPPDDIATVLQDRYEGMLRLFRLLAR